MSAAAPPRWLTATQVEMLHAASLARFGGRPGLRDRALLESAVARARQRFAYDDAPGLPALAAATAYGLARNHPFVDGNKRAALLALRAFLFVNGHAFDPPEAETVAVIEALAAGDVDEAELARWVARHARPG